MSRIKSSFNGIIDEIPFISVDNFENVDRCAYFLSHYHMDHVSGLNKIELYNSLIANNAYIYASEVTAAIIVNEYSKLEKCVRRLKLGRNVITVNTKNTNEIFTVILLPAGHCFGSVMFMFKINDKTILHTGDFRLSPNTVKSTTHFHKDNGEPTTIDTMYVDTTFQRVQSFPTRQETVESVVLEVKKWIDKGSKHCVALHTSARYGYEFIFKEIYKAIGMKVYIDKKLWDIYSQFKDLEPSVTKDPGATRVHVCRNRKENDTHRHCLLNPEGSVFLYMHFSAMKWSNYDENESFIDKRNNRIDICFATHCSRSELIFFIHYLSPKRVVGFPDPFIDSPVKSVNIPVKNDGDYRILPKKKRLCFVDAKVGREVDKKILKDMFD